MDPRFLQYYNRELQHVREMGGEFAKEFPKIAGRLGMENLEVADPYVERLLESFAFMSARVQLKLDSQYPQFTQHLFEMLYPHYLMPTPSMAVVQFEPQLGDPSLNEGVLIPRDTKMMSSIAKDQATACEYRTAHDMTLWPLELTEVHYFPTAAALANVSARGDTDTVAGLRISLRCHSAAFEELKLDRLPVYFRGAGDVPKALYEQVLGNATGLILRTKGGASAKQVRLGAEHIISHGFDAEQRLLPFTDRSFDGYRLVQEYFAFPKRFFFAEFTGLGDFVAGCPSTEIELIVLLNRSVDWLENAIDPSHFALFCTPAINLFPKRADRVTLDRGQPSYHVLADRTKPQDYEVHALTEVRGVGGAGDVQQKFRPFYTSRDPIHDGDQYAYYTTAREPRSISSRQRREGTRSSYVGSEMYISVVDSRQAPFSPDLKQLEIFTLCSNRDLPLHMTTGKGTTDFSLDEGGPVKSVRCLAGPTSPRPAPVLRESAWRLLSQLSLNYLSLVQEDEGQGALVLKQMLSLYADTNDQALRKQIEGLKSVQSQQIVRRVPEPGIITYGRGVEVTINCEEDAFEGTGAYLFGAVMEQFFSKYESLNSFSETVLRSDNRGEVRRWPARLGRRHKL